VTTTITVADNTPDIYLQSLSMSITPGTTNGLTVGNGATAGGVTIDKGTNAAINANVRRGVVTLNDTSNSFAGVTWIVNNGAILSAAASGAFVDSTAVTVQSGGTLVAKTTDGISLAPTFQGGSRLWAGLAAGYTGSPTLDLTASGAILDIRNATALSGTQTILTGAGTVIRLAASSVVLPTSGAEVPSPAATYELISTTQASASVAALLLDGGGYTNDATSRTEASTNRAVNFVNGATLSATTGTTFTLGELIGGTGTLTVGSTSPIDGLDKQGTIVLQNAGNSLAAVDVAAGVLRVDSSVARLGGATGLNVADSAKLWFNFTNPSLTSVAFSGGGTVQIGNGTSTLTLVGGDVGPGNSPGVLTIDGNLTISDTAMFILTIDVNGGSLLPGVGFDQLAVETLTSTGSADELANIDLVVDIHGAAGIAPTDQLPFLTTTNTLSGLFKSVTVNGGTADVVVTGNGAYLTNVVPEPATLVLLGLGFLPLVLRRKRR
jgi:hypothetical protein